MVKLEETNVELNAKYAKVVEQNKALYKLN